MTPGVSAQRYGEHIRGRRVCVTGGAGFIGSHLTEALVNLGADVTVVDDLSNGHESNLQSIRSRARFIRGSILDESALAEAIGGAAVIFHLAAAASVPRSLEEPTYFHAVNATGTLKVLETARRVSPDCRVIYSASSSAYGDDPTLPKVETIMARPLSPYAASKCAGEHLLHAYAHSFDLRGLSLRYFNIFGPRQRGDSPYAAAIPIFALALMQGRRPTIFGAGTQTRDFTHVSNAVHANLLAATCDASRLRGQTVNIACGSSCSILDLLSKIAGILGVEPECDHAPSRKGDVKYSQASIDSARNLLAYEPIISFEDGLVQTVRWFREACGSSVPPGH